MEASCVGCLEKMHTFSGELAAGCVGCLEKLRTFSGELAARCGSLLEKTVQLLGGWPAGHPCTFSELRGMLDSWGTAREIYVVFQVSSRSTNWVTGWKNYAIF